MYQKSTIVSKVELIIKLSTFLCFSRKQYCFIPKKSRLTKQVYCPNIVLLSFCSFFALKIATSVSVNAQTKNEDFRLYWPESV